MKNGIKDLLINVPILYFLIRENVIVTFWKDLCNLPFNWYLPYRIGIMVLVWIITVVYITNGIKSIYKYINDKKGYINK